MTISFIKGKKRSKPTSLSVKNEFLPKPGLQIRTGCDYL